MNDNVDGESPINRNLPGFDFLDDVSVVGVPDAGSTLSLLSFASLGLVALRRKLRC
jgi:hypothetical protein